MTLKKSKNQSGEIASLKKRIKILEQENEKTCDAIREISTFLSQMTVIVTSLAAEVSSATPHASNGSNEDEIDKILKSCFPSDDDGYIH